MAMFNKNGQDTTQKKGSHKQINIIGKDTVIEGVLETDDNIRIGGTVYGEVKSSGTVVVTKGGKIEGDLNAHAADISGYVEGELEIDEKLIIRSSATIEGNIKTQTLNVEEGGCFTGSCIMDNKNEGSKKQSPKASKQSSAA